MKMDENGTTNATNNTNGSPQMGAPPGQTTVVKVALVIIGVLALLGNTVVVSLILTRRRLRTKTNVMVMSLAISDICVAVGIIPSFLTCMYVKCDNNLSKLFYDAFLFISVCNLCCITFDRFLAVTRPLRYHITMTRRRAFGMVIFSWIVPTVMSLIPVAWQYTDTGPEKVVVNNKIFYTVQVVIFMFFPCLIMLVAYAVIYNIAWKQTKHINKTFKNLNSLNRRFGEAVPNTTTREAKATLKVFGTVVVVFVICWSLSAFRTIVTNYKLLDSLPIDLILTSRLLLVANSAINPIIYALWKKDIKYEIRKLLPLNRRTVRPSSVYRSSQGDIRSEITTREEMKLGNSSQATRQEVGLAQLKPMNQPPNGIVHDAVLEAIESEETGAGKNAQGESKNEEDEGEKNVNDETKEQENERKNDTDEASHSQGETNQQESSGFSPTLQLGTPNLACEVDGMV